MTKAVFYKGQKFSFSPDWALGNSFVYTVLEATPGKSVNVRELTYDAWGSLVERYLDLPIKEEMFGETAIVPFPGGNRTMFKLWADRDDSVYEDEYTPSATAGDYSPSCPWNAPGMSIRDFI